MRVTIESMEGNMDKQLVVHKWERINIVFETMEYESD